MKILLSPGIASQELSLLPDSSIAPRSMPVFIPDYSLKWRAEWRLTWRVGRLGKDILPQFAPRYIDGVTMMVHLTPARPKVTQLDLCADYTCVLGQCVSLNDVNIIQTYDFQAELTAEDSGVYDLVVSLSKYMTLKTGDLIATRPMAEAEIDRYFTALLNGTQVMKQKIVKN